MTNDGSAFRLSDTPPPAGLGGERLAAWLAGHAVAVTRKPPEVAPEDNPAVAILNRQARLVTDVKCNCERGRGSQIVAVYLWRGERYAWFQGRRMPDSITGEFRGQPPVAAALDGDGWTRIAECPRCHASWLAQTIGPARFDEDHAVVQRSRPDLPPGVPMPDLVAGERVTLWRWGTPAEWEALVPGLWVHRLGDRVIPPNGVVDG